MNRKILVMLLAAFSALCIAAPETIYEKNRLELIKPMKQGELLLRPTFNSCSFYYGTDKLENPVLEFRKQGGDWRKAFAPVHFFEDQNTETGLVMNEYRGSIVKLEENTPYEVRFKDGDNVLKTGKFTTWKTNVPVAKTIYIDANTFKAPYTISAQGTPDGWIRYTSKNGKTIKGQDGSPVFIVKNAKYILLDDMTIIGGKNNQNAIKLVTSHNVRIRNCDISGWGRVGKAKFDTPKARGALYFKNARGQYRAINYDGAIDISQGNSSIVVERCYIHDPVGRANSWYYCHPAGPQAIVCTKPDHTTVIRYNDFIGSDIHRFNDAVEGPGNFHSNGGINRDADVYGNYMIYSNDDGIELDGGQQNVRCFWNHFEGSLCGVSIQGCMVSPVYVFENIFGGICGEYGEINASIKNSGKCGINPIAFIFNNTFAGKGSGIRFTPLFPNIVKNNIMLDTQYIGGLKQLNKSKLSSNSSEIIIEKHEGIEKAASKLVNHKHGLFAPVDVQPAEHIDNFCDEEDAVRGALQKRNSPPLPFRPIPVTLSRTRIADVKIQGGKVLPGEIKIIATVGGKNFKSAYSIRKNNVFDWMEITPAKGILKSGDKITFTVKFKPEKMNKRQHYRGAFILRLANGFSRPVSVYAETDFIQPFKLDKSGDKAVYVNAFAPSAVFNSKNKQKSTLLTAKDKMGLNGKVAVTDNSRVYEYKINVPEAGRYYFLIRGYNKRGKTTRVIATINGKKSGISNQQVVQDRMRWTIITPGAGMGFKAEYFDLPKGVCTLQIQGKGHQLHFDGLVLTTDPEAFEPR